MPKIWISHWQPRCCRSSCLPLYRWAPSSPRLCDPHIWQLYWAPIHPLHTKFSPSSSDPNQDGQVLSRTQLPPSLARGSKIHKFQGHTLGKLVIKIERSAGTAFEVFEALYRTATSQASWFCHPWVGTDLLILPNLPICASVNLKNRDS